MKITYRQFVEAMRKNGYKKARQNFIVYDIRGQISNRLESSFYYPEYADQIESACAIGQAALNLHIHPKDITSAMNFSIKSRIYELNDETDTEVPFIADKIEIEFASHMDKELGDFEIRN